MARPRRAEHSASGARFGAALAALRVATLRPLYSGGVVRRVSNGPVSWVLQGPMSQNELGRCAGIDAAYVNRLERGACPPPSRDVVARLAVALELDSLASARLFVLAGYWPWPDDAYDDVDLAVATALAVVEGDYRTLG